MNRMELVKRWKYIEAFLEKVTDPILKNVLRYEFQERAIRDWGFCPAEIILPKKETETEPELMPFEQPVYDRIRAYLTYGVDIRTDEEKHKLENETLNSMIDFINRGGTYWDIPENIRCPSLKKIYDNAFEIVFTK